MAQDTAQKKYLNFKEIAAYSLGLFGFQAIVGLLNSYQAEFFDKIMKLNLVGFWLRKSCLPLPTPLWEIWLIVQRARWVNLSR